MPTLAERGRSAAIIVIPAAADETERFAAQELAKYVQLVSGATLPVYQGKSPVARPMQVFVGSVPGFDRNDAVVGAADAVPDHSQGYLIRALADGTVFLLGRESAGALWAVYSFVRDVLDVGFVGLGPLGDEIPERETIELPHLDRAESPACSRRGLMNVGPEEDAPDPVTTVSPLAVDRLDWMAKHRMNSLLLHAMRLDAGEVERFLVPEARKRGIRLEWSHHNMGFWLPSSVYGKDHPEYYAVRDAIRTNDRATQLCLCTSNPDVVSEVAKNILRFWDEHPWVDEVGIWPNDGYGMCECDACARDDFYTDEENREHTYFPNSNDPIPLTVIDRNKTNRYVRFLNDVAERVVSERPDARISALFYIDVVRPAPDFELHPAIDAIVALYWRCSAHALDDPDCPTNAYFSRIVDEWTRYAPGRVSFYEYYMGMGEYISLPFPILGTMQADWPVFASKGIVGANIQSRGSHHTAYALNYAAFAALAWNAEEDLQDFTREWFARAYGPAANAVLAWWGELEKRMAAIGESASVPTSENRRPTCYTPTRLNFPSLWDQGKMAVHGIALDQAKGLRDLSPRQRRRLNQLRAYHTYCVASAAAYADELAARRAVADGESKTEHARRVLDGIESIEAYLTQIADPTILAAPWIYRYLDRIREEWRS